MAVHSRIDPEEIYSLLYGELKGDHQARLRDPFVLHERVLHGIVDARYGGAQGGALQPVKYGLDIRTIGITNDHDRNRNLYPLSPPVNSLSASSLWINEWFAKKS
jgi:hypothetical protein